ncbi:hypothetical protein QTH91_20235 [Variovorax dokdonensis]|uniref:Uncharacterized protein n=1 Tax=Variovorax dokdonensis TaxID=344883 RepID=A0ABT7NFU7_9BURK|nr:hypothetical protein [Variovorax dokdonensis]MDM0046832.1 hypothetical protein [Variovorax dokdonensis]
MRRFLSTFDRSDQIAALALVVSVAVALIAFVVSERDKEFRRLSTLPALSLSFVDGSDDARTGFILRNTGLGPARVLNVQVFVRNNLVAEIYNDDQWVKVLAELKRVRPSAPSSTSVRFKSFMSDFYMAPGEVVPLMFQKNSELTESSAQFLRNAANDLAFGVCVCSIYEECWQFRSPGLRANPCDSPLAEYFLGGSGTLADALRNAPRMLEPWKPK